MINKGSILNLCLWTIVIFTILGGNQHFVQPAFGYTNWDKMMKFCIQLHSQIVATWPDHKEKSMSSIKNQGFA